MRLMIFSVYDKAVKAYLQPFYARTKGEAIRMFSDAANKEGQFRTHALDYVMMYLGEYDDNSGLFECKEPERVVAASDVIVDEAFKEESEIKEVTPLRRPM